VLVLHHFQHAGGKTAELESVHVTAARRGQGIGTMLLRAAEDHANAQGCYRVQLTSNVSRFDAHRFYERLGYVASHRGFKKALTR
jgi:GNAT superfamily N-acetyltransferase